MARHSSAWKGFERRVAETFGGIRAAFSGARPDITGTRADVKHDRLFIEAKWRERHSLMTLWRDTAEKARREYKVPIICLAEKNKPGFLICFHSDHLEALARPDNLSDLPLFGKGNDGK